MGFKTGISTQKSSLQKAWRRRRLQLKALYSWLADLADDKETVSLAQYCERFGVDTRGIRKLMTEPSVHERIQSSIDTAALQGVKITSSVLLRRLETESNGMPTKEMILIASHLAKIRGGGYGAPAVAGSQVKVEINLPVFEERTREVRARVVEQAQEKLDGLA